jgi:hypothetical protein
MKLSEIQDDEKKFYLCCVSPGHDGTDASFWQGWMPLGREMPRFENIL